jgi:hypothetical protein
MQDARATSGRTRQYRTGRTENWVEDETQKAVLQTKPNIEINMYQ